MPARTLGGVDELGALVVDVVLQDGRHDLVRCGERMHRVIAPLGANLLRFLVFKGRAEPKHPIGAEYPEVADSARVESVPYVLPQTENMEPRAGR